MKGGRTAIQGEPPRKSPPERVFLGPESLSGKSPAKPLIREKNPPEDERSALGEKGGFYKTEKIYGREARG